MRIAAILLISALAMACGGDGDRVRDACSRILTATCDKFVACHVIAGGGSITKADCQELLPRAIDECVSESGALIASATDQTVDDCVIAYQGFACSNICDRVPADPPVCRTLSPEPAMEVVYCE